MNKQIKLVGHNEMRWNLYHNIGIW